MRCLAAVVPSKWYASATAPTYSARCVVERSAMLALVQLTGHQTQPMSRPRIRPRMSATISGAHGKMRLTVGFIEDIRPSIL